MVGKVVWTTLKLLGFIGLIINAEKEVVGGRWRWVGGIFSLKRSKGMKFSVFMPVKKPPRLGESASVCIRNWTRLFEFSDHNHQCFAVSTSSWKEIQRALIVCGGHSAAITVLQDGIVGEYICTKRQLDNIFQCFCVFWPKSRLPDSSF